MPSRSRTRVFSTSDPNVVIVCDYNPDNGQYNLNCRRMRREDAPRHIMIDESFQNVALAAAVETDRVPNSRN